MSPTLEAIFQRRAVKVFEPVEIPQFSSSPQPYRFYWVESPSMRKSAATLHWPEPRKDSVGLGRGCRRHWIMAIDHTKPFRMGAPTGLPWRESL